ncbi:SET domain-containing protein [Diaporthe helianthi]|uniref:Ribosomal lysine N-methyltransferase 4 n=1 Tax=Diaporthe helianthi TaxID=158607 RepID=A0A2P5I929_DIAHE|nr:SET domain-containing protein [Diaporthe helianthi]
MTPYTFDQKTSEFLSWFRAQPGTTFHHDIEVRDLRDRGAGRGIVAKADISPDTVLFTIPRQSIICTSTSSLAAKIPGLFGGAEEQDDGVDNHMNSEGGEAEDEDGDDDKSQDSWTSLILVLIYEYLQGANSSWKPYLDVLPTIDDFSTPMFWAADELAELQASPVADKVGRDEADKMVRTKILPVVRAHPAVFFPEGTAQLGDDELVQLAFRMGSVIMAYAFDLEKEDDEDKKSQESHAEEVEEDEWVEDREGKTMLGMVPMADILNADATFNAHIEHGEHALTATSLRPIAAGEEIFNYYGPLSNGELLRRYGYTTHAHRRWNLVDLEWGPVLAALRAEVPLPAKQWDEIVGGLDEDELEEAFVIERGAEDPDSEGRVAEVEKAAGAPEELVEQLKAVMKAVKKVRPDALPDKVARDKIIYSAISRALDERTRQYGTTLEQDLKRYEESSDGADQKVRRQRMALDVRIGEKVLLRQATDTVRAKLAELTKAESDGEKPSAKRRRV